MGFFGSRHQDQPVYNEPEYQEYQQEQTPPPAPTPVPSTDGFIPAPAVPDPSGTSAPMIDDHMHDDDANGYIMADAPVASPAVTSVPVGTPAPSTDDPAYQPVDEPAPVTDAPSESNEPQSEPEQPAEAFTASEPPQPADTPGPAAESSSAPSTDTLHDLADIKRQALEQLSPLVAHLDQSPEEKFHTAMMMLQATDDRALAKVAYEAAQAITDDKARAQALLDIINEITYLSDQS